MDQPVRVGGRLPDRIAPAVDNSGDTPHGSSASVAGQLRSSCEQRRPGGTNERTTSGTVRDVLILGIILFGLLIGAAAQKMLGTGSSGVDWALALIAGLVGSLVGGLLLSLLFGDGLELRPSGIVGSIVGAVILTYAWKRFGPSKMARTAPNRRS
jgi:uncharacterized membrane protein YeaQ/YmgE (transglycosylase-associated protein family)